MNCFFKAVGRAVLLYGSKEIEPVKVSFHEDWNEADIKAQRLNNYVKKSQEEDNYMALRDQFAMAVLPLIYKEWASNRDEVIIAALVYTMADAMLAERAKRG